MVRFPDVDEGTLSKWRASLVNESTLSEIGRDLRLNEHLYLGKSELSQRENPRPRLLASSFEAVLGAIYMDGGLVAAKGLIERLFNERLLQLDDQNLYAMDFKTRLQEWTQKRMKTVPEYRLLSSEGPEHAKIFRYQVSIQDKATGEGEGTSRKSAEQAAARNALRKLSDEGEQI
jgi:ribonuclease-3